MTEWLRQYIQTHPNWIWWFFGIIFTPILWEVVREWLDNREVERELDDILHESEADRAIARARLRKEKQDALEKHRSEFLGCAGWGCLSGVGGCGMIAIILFVIGGIIGLALIGWDRLVN